MFSKLVSRIVADGQISRNHLRNVIQLIRNGMAIFEHILGSYCLAKKNEKLD